MTLGKLYFQKPLQLKRLREDSVTSGTRSLAWHQERSVIEFTGSITTQPRSELNDSHLAVSKRFTSPLTSMLLKVSLCPFLERAEM